MNQIEIYCLPGGGVAVRCPVGIIPDRATLERVSEIIRYRKEAVA